MQFKLRSFCLLIFALSLELAMAQLPPPPPPAGGGGGGGGGAAPIDPVSGVLLLAGGAIGAKKYIFKGKDEEG